MSVAANVQSCSFMKKRPVSSILLNLAAGLVMLGGIFDMLLPSVPENLLAYLKISRAALSPELAALLLGILRALGGCLFAIGLGSLLIINGPLLRGERGAVPALLILIGISETINASQMWRFGSPFYFPLAFVAITLTGLAIRKPATVATSSLPHPSA